MHLDSSSVEVPRPERQEVYILKETLVAPSNAASIREATTCGKTFAVAAAISMQVKIRPDGFERVIDSRVPDKTKVTFVLERLAEIPFEPFAGETIDEKALIERMLDPEWIDANRNHPIAYMFWAIKNYAGLVKAIRKKGGLMVFKRRGRAHCVIGGDEAANRDILQKAKFSEEEILEILEKLKP